MYLWFDLNYFTVPKYGVHINFNERHIKRVQRHATKYILNDYTSCYKTHLIKLRLLPPMYLFEIQDILFAINLLRHHQVILISQITLSSVLLTLDQVQAINFYFLTTKIIYLDIYIFTDYRYCGMLCQSLI